MAVYYKFKSAKDYDSIPIDGHFISVGNLKERIFESKHLGRGTDFDLMVTNAQTNEEYVDEATLIPKNTSLLIRRVPGRPRMPIVAERDEPKIVENKVEDIPPTSSMSMADSSAMRFPDESEWDEFGNDLYAIPEVPPVQSSNLVLDVPPPNRVDEESMIKALIDTPALDWQRQIQEPYGPGRGFGRGMGGRMMAGRGFDRGGMERGLERKTPPQGYICHRCKVPGHFIQHCPTNGDPNYDIRRVKPPTGIPRSMLMATPDGSYALPSGAVAVLRPNEAAFEKEIEGLPSTRPVTDLPPELRCPLCKEVMKDAVLTSKCCFNSFCDKCIRDYILSKSMCICGATNILADDLLPNKTVRETIDRILELTTSSAENAGSLVQAQDMESAHPAQPKAPSPTLSAASKSGHNLPPIEDSPNMKESEVASEGKAANFVVHSMERRAGKNTDLSEATPGSVSAREPTSQESAPVPEEVQEKHLAGEQGKKKKKKKIRLPGSASDMQWRGFQDLGAENFAGMPMAPSAYNNSYWPGMPWGYDGYVAPYTGAMPYMGYTPGPFDLQYGGVLPQDPYAAQGYMLPVGPQRDLSELGMGGMSMNQGPPVMSREEFEARKADLRRKREIERFNERDHSKDREISREVSSNADISSMKSKPRLMSQAANVERLDRSEKAATTQDRHHPARDSTRDSVRHSPPRTTAKRRPPEHEEAAAGDSKSDKKQKRSVFSRISFPAAGEAGSKKRKSSELPNGLKEHEAPVQRPASNGYREEWKAPAKSGSGVGGRRREYEHESSDDEYHFKRRPSSSTTRHEAVEWEEEGRPSRGSREREHERPSTKRR